MDAYFSDPALAPPPAPRQAQADPAVLAAHLKVQGQLAIERERMQGQIALKREQLAAELQLKRQQIEAEAQLRALEAQAQAPRGEALSAGHLGGDVAG